MRAPAHAQVEAEAKAKAEAARRAEEARLAEERAKEMRRQRIFNTPELGEYFEAADDVAEKMVRTGILRESAADDSDRQAWSSDDLGTDTSVDDVSAGKTGPSSSVSEDSYYEVCPVTHAMLWGACAPRGRSADTMLNRPALGLDGPASGHE